MCVCRMSYETAPRDPWRSRRVDQHRGTEEWMEEATDGGGGEEGGGAMLEGYEEGRGRGIERRRGREAREGGEGWGGGGLTNDDVVLLPTYRAHTQHTRLKLTDKQYTHIRSSLRYIHTCKV